MLDDLIQEYEDAAAAVDQAHEEALAMHRGYKLGFVDGATRVCDLVLKVLA
jgi:hypothetical protein